MEKLFKIPIFEGKQTFEKMISGMYMGELTRQVRYIYADYP